jgi:hypothetical protein
MRFRLFSMPSSPLERLLSNLRELLFIKDPEPLYAVLGTIAANIIEGDPVWLQLIAPPSYGKTETLRATLDIPHVVEIANISSDAAFLSGTPTRERAKDADGGLLCRIGSHGILILNDLTSILSMPKEKMNSIMAVFREAYGGSWTREVASDGGRFMRWDGKLGVLVGVTPIIDSHQALFNEMGERYINYRYTEHDVIDEAMMTLSADRQADWRAEIRKLVKTFFEEQGLAFGTHLPRRVFTEEEKQYVYELASMAARCRSAVPRDPYTRETLSTRHSEAATRLTAVLGQLLQGLDRIGVPEPTRWRLLNKIALDCMPDLRRQFLKFLIQEPHSTKELSHLTGCCMTVAARTVEDLKMQEIVYRERGKVHLASWMQKNRQNFTNYHRKVCEVHEMSAAASGD